jgi:hypothetical protein
MAARTRSMTASGMRIAVIMPVGVGETETRRFKDTADSLLANEPAVRWLVVLDDAPSERDLVSQIRNAQAEVVVLRSSLNHNIRDRESRITAGVLTSLRWAADNTDCDVVMKIDTDALVISSFAADIGAALADETIGMLGSYDEDPNGARRSFDVVAPSVKRAANVLHPLQLRVIVRARRARRFIRESRSAGYEWGEHVLGCAVAIPRRTLVSLRADGSLDDPEAFTGTRLYDDPVLAILVRRGGYRIAGHVHEHGGFGVSWRGLPDTPERLTARGFSIIHSVKNDKRLTEDEIRSFFRNQRQSIRTPQR